MKQYQLVLKTKYYRLNKKILKNKKMRYNKIATLTLKLSKIWINPKLIILCITILLKL